MDTERISLRGEFSFHGMTFPSLVSVGNYFYWSVTHKTTQVVRILSSLLVKENQSDDDALRNRKLSMILDFEMTAADAVKVFLDAVDGFDVNTLQDARIILENFMMDPAPLTSESVNKMCSNLTTVPLRLQVIKAFLCHNASAAAHSFELRPPGHEISMIHQVASPNVNKQSLFETASPSPPLLKFPPPLAFTPLHQMSPLEPFRSATTKSYSKQSPVQPKVNERPVYDDICTGDTVKHEKLLSLSPVNFFDDSYDFAVSSQMSSRASSSSAPPTTIGNPCTFDNVGVQAGDVAFEH